jgi:hypothetical protein
MKREWDIWKAEKPFPHRRRRSAAALQAVLLSSRRPRNLLLPLSLALALTLPACSSVEFPAVHEMPAARPAAERLSAEDQKKAEAELMAARDIQRTGIVPPPATASAKKKPASAPTREAAAGNGQKP